MNIPTNRLLLSPFTLEDVDHFHAINTTPFVRKYLWDDQIIDWETSREIMRLNAAHFEERGFGLWKIQRKEIPEIIGYSGLWYLFEEDQPQLLYAIREEYSRQGYALEASQAVLDYAFSVLDFDYLIAATDEPNYASQKVAERIGMRLVDKRVEKEKLTLFYRINRW